ncbi:unnamed protein product [Soboliphyme baturini]|uniref:Signal transducer and activator of transcription n=1 Tax=Soboliphyme baturini TaxID=241478 RepID=A0A183IBJ7_9BILA|nr:unnamed protein product [Soboliphyme baturini]
MDNFMSSIVAAEKVLQKINMQSKECDAFWQQTNDLQSQFIAKLGIIQNLQLLMSQKGDGGGGGGERGEDGFDQKPSIVTTAGGDQGENLTDKLKKSLELVSRQAGKLYHTLIDTRKAFLLMLKECTETVNTLRKELVNGLLLEWKCCQKLAQIGFPFERQDEQLDRLGRLFEGLAEEVWTLRTYVLWLRELLTKAPRLPDQNVQQCLTVLEPILGVFTHELRTIVHRSFVVSKQPNVVLKQHNKFSAEARLLVGDKFGIKFFNLKVGVRLISEEYARALKPDSMRLPQASTVAKIGGFGAVGDAAASNDCQEVNLEVDRETRRVHAVFKSKLLKVDPRKAANKSTDEQQQMSVCERNYALLFTCSPFKLGDISFNSIWALSLPVKLTVHGSQERLSQAMILWDHAFASPETPFNIPDAVDWLQLSEALQKNGGQLPCQSQNSDSASTTATMVTLQKFCKDPMREDLDFSFWSWFFEITLLIKQKLLRLWDDGLIKGFISRKDAAATLLALPQPSFLLRFSDSHLGGISISFSADLEDGRREVVYGSDKCYSKAVIFRSEADMKLKSLPINRETYPYVTSELIMVAHTTVPCMADSESTPVSPSQGACSSPGDTLSSICENEGIEPELLSDTVDLNNFDWNNLGMYMIDTAEDPQPMEIGEFLDMFDKLYDIDYPQGQSIGNGNTEMSG